MEYADCEDYIYTPGQTFRPTGGLLFRDEETGGLAYVDYGNAIATHKAVYCMIKGLLKYYNNMEESEITEYNEMVKRVNQQEAESQSSGDSFKISPTKPREGFVYFIKDDQGRIKIGKAVDIKQRMGEYTKLPFVPEVTLLFECSDYNATELYFHRHFEDRHIRGEWYKIPDADINNLKQGLYPETLQEYILCQVEYNHG